MKQPNIGKRLLPLLDVIFILLSLFIILPQGITSTELEQNDWLNTQNKKLQRNLKYYKWKFGTDHDISSRKHKSLILITKNDKIYIESTSVSFEKLRETLIGEQITFVLIRHKDTRRHGTRRETLDTLFDILKELAIGYVTTYN